MGTDATTALGAPNRCKSAYGTEWLGPQNKAGLSRQIFASEKLNSTEGLGLMQIS